MTQPPTAEKRSWLDRHLISSLPFVTVESIVFVSIIALAIVSRLYDLGLRAMSHDESLHTYFSWLYYRGNGYEHNPMMHGPFQFHLLALAYYLFGANDFIARLPHALFSILNILILWNWRRYLGRAGTLVAAVLMLISPFVLYYGRYARNETFTGVLG
ncbi:MAG: hypothetical protein FJZ96_12890, partial [Chloroflexi bacterium]|nr:hypothetical protein [Chloroflexota bacterium]